MNVDVPTLTVLDEIWQDKTVFDGTLYCPGCGNSVCMIGLKGVIQGFEAQCNACNSPLFSFSTVAASNTYYQEYGEPTPKEMEECVTEYWNKIVKEGVETEIPDDYEQEGIMVDGEFRVVPDVEPVMETVDVTADYIRQFEHASDEFGWGWEELEE